jgi:TonB family protein
LRHTVRGGRGASFWLMCAALAASGYAADVHGAPGETAAASPSQLDEWNRTLIQLRESVWQVYEATAALGKDPRGRTIADDLNEWVVAEDARVQLTTLGTEAERQYRAGNGKQAGATLESGRSLLEEQARRLSLVNYYWQQSVPLNRLRDLWLRVAEQAPERAAARSRERMHLLEAALVENYAASTTWEALTRQIEALKRGYNQERVRLAGLVSEQRAAAGDAPPQRQRLRPCPEKSEAPVSSSTSADRPTQIRKDPPAEQFYPASARKYEISGKVTLHLTITSTGCMVQSQVVRSSGAPELDDAASALAEYTDFLPALREGRPIESRPERTVNFMFEDEERKAEAAKNPSTVDRLVDRLVDSGSASLDRGELDSALRDFDQALETDPSSAMALADRGMTYFWKNDNEKARRDFDAAYSFDPENAVVFRGRAMLALRGNEYASAIAAFTTSLELDRLNLFALQWRAQAYFRGNELGKALADATEVIRLKPSSVDMYAFRAMLYRAQKRFDLALAEADAVVTAAPTEARAYAVAGTIYSAGGKSDEAMHAFDRAVEMQPTESTYLTRARYRRREDKSGRRADIDAALNLNSHSTSALSMLARWQIDNGDFDGAAATVNAALTKQLDSPHFLLLRGVAYAKSNRADLADSDFQLARAKAAKPSDFNSICWDLATSGVQLSFALASCDAAIAMLPNEPSFLDSRAFVLLRLGRYAEAIAGYDAALKMRAASAESLYGRALAKRHRDGNAALADIQAALALDANVGERFHGYGLEM